MELSKTVQLILSSYNFLFLPDMQFFIAKSYCSVGFIIIFFMQVLGNTNKSSQILGYLGHPKYGSC